MGNWHCISSSCAEVVYQEYEPPKIRWRYPGENWQEIIGDNYTTGIASGQCSIEYKFEIRFARETAFRDGYEWRQADVRVVTTGYGPISNIYLKNTATGQIYKDVVKNPQINYNNDPQHGYLTEFINTGIVINNNTYTVFWTEGDGVEYSRGIATGYAAYRACNFAPLYSNQVDNCACFFNITNKEKTVHQETRAVCPEIEKIPCKLSDVRHSIEIKKLPYLEKVEVVPYQYSAYKLPGVPAPIVQADQIPAECLNIYNNAIYVIPPSGQAIYPNATPFDSFVAQICSYPGCPPPEYQVICDCNNCQSCPDGTCPIECDDHICCYNDYGISVQSIPASDYCGGVT